MTDGHQATKTAHPDALDDPASIARFDGEGMLALLRDLPDQCRRAWAGARTAGLPAGYRAVDNVVVLGMGGSAIAADLLRPIVSGYGRAPIYVHRGYDLPPYVDRSTLLIASSHSGDTEEVLSAFGQGLRCPARKLAITTGGRLLEMAESLGIPTIRFESRSPPRAAIGYSLMSLLAVLEMAGIVPGVGDTVEDALDTLTATQATLSPEVPALDNPAKQLAHRMHDRLPVVYGAGALAEVAHRWKTQMNENAKTWCFHEALPEANHNALVAYCLPARVAGSAFVVLLGADAMPERIRLRYEFVRSVLAEAGVASADVPVPGRTPLSQILNGVLFGDYVSCYLALLNEVSPSHIGPIDRLKDFLSGRP
jgi:glucose/mannose-6-phosphate isomerase